MTPSRRAVVVAVIVLAVATFAVVQDRVTAAGARAYAAMARAAVARGQRPPDIEAVMAPAIRRSVRWGAAAGGLVLLLGMVMARRAGRSGTG